MANPLPALDTPVIDTQTGKMTQVWFDYFFQHQRLTQLPDVSAAVAPTNGQALVYNSTSKLWVPT